MIADRNFNPWKVKVADTQAKRNPGTLGIWGPKGTRVVASEAMWREPLKWEKAAKAAIDGWALRPVDFADPRPHRPRVFCASMADVFESWDGDIRNSRGEVMINCPKCGWESYKANEPPLPSGCSDIPLTLADVRRRLFKLIDDTPHLDWLLLTKRPENIIDMMPLFRSPGIERVVEAWPRHKNVWIGTSIEDQQTADERIPHLLRVPAAVRFLSVEPLLGPIRFHHDKHNLEGGIHWGVIGGESGPNARGCNTEWIRDIYRQFDDAAVKTFIKQLGKSSFYQTPDMHGPQYLHLRDEKGCNWDEWPEDLRVREFPTVEARS